MKAVLDIKKKEGVSDVINSSKFVLVELLKETEKTFTYMIKGERKDIFTLTKELNKL